MKRSRTHFKTIFRILNGSNLTPTGRKRRFLSSFFKGKATFAMASKLIYWISTLWLALGMISTAIVQLINMQGEVDTITQLGYPVYFLTLLGIWKILGVVALLIPKFPLLKEWAYAGFFFAMSGAIVSHIASGNSISKLLPSLLLLVLIVISWQFRPADRKIFHPSVAALNTFGGKNI